MRIILVNKFYYNRGGDTTAVLSLESLLKTKGHDVAVFSMQYPENVDTEWEKYFPSNIDFSNPGIPGKLSAAARIFHSKEVERKFNLLIKDFKPDIAHLHNIHSYISPLVAQIAKAKDIRVVWTLHDYKLICPAYSFLRKGKVCEDCFTDRAAVFKSKCMKSSCPASALAWMEALWWNRKKLSHITDSFISPSSFLKSKMVQGGYPAEKIAVVPNFIPPDKIPEQAGKKENYYCYVGRISVEKGLDTLLEAAIKLKFNLKVIGAGPLLDSFRKIYNSPGIEFLGPMSHDLLYPIVSKAQFMVIPSICYENNPYSVIESLCLGTPVLGADIGGIPELIKEGENGFLFSPGNTEDLYNKIKLSFKYFPVYTDFNKIAPDAQNKFGAETFYNKLMEIYER
jgi:glycosyltransferase involved in cell wall biosynthesis